MGPAERNIGLLPKFVFVLDVHRAFVPHGLEQLNDTTLIRSATQIRKTSSDIVSEPVLSLEMYLRFAHDIEIYRFGFVIVFKTLDL